MAHRLILSLIMPAVALAGCATDRSVKPLLTARAASQIATACGAVRSEFSIDRNSLPIPTFIIPADEATPANGPAPSVKCIGEKLGAFRYSFFSFRAAGVSAP